MKLVQGPRPAESPPERVAPVERAGGPRTPRGGESAPRRPATPGSRMRCISEELLREAKRLYGLGLTLRAVAETLLDQTGYANAHGAEVALRFQFKRRGWPLRGRAKAEGGRQASRPDDLTRAA